MRFQARRKCGSADRVDFRPAPAKFANGLRVHRVGCGGFAAHLLIQAGELKGIAANHCNSHRFQGSARRIATIGLTYPFDAIVCFNFHDGANAQGACKP